MSAGEKMRDGLKYPKIEYATSFKPDKPKTPIVLPKKRKGKR